MPRKRLTRYSAIPAVALGAALLAGGCVSSTAKAIRSGLIGLPGTSVRACLGDIEFLEPRASGVELWGFVRPYEGEVADIEIALATGPGTAFKRPTVQAGDPEEKSGVLEDGGPRRVAAGSCLYLFEMQGGKVTAVQLRGRSFTNMNADAECAVAIRRCVPEPGVAPQK
jgi:hypothetical protein